VCWDEFLDMHELFETSEPPFAYRDAGTGAVLDACRTAWERDGDGPLVTMDAGPNVHLLFRQGQPRERLIAPLAARWRVLTSAAPRPA
jgi:diphosphomevalonate decarboxylase